MRAALMMNNSRTTARSGVFLVTTGAVRLALTFAFGRPQAEDATNVTGPPHLDVIVDLSSVGYREVAAKSARNFQLPEPGTCSSSARPRWQRDKGAFEHKPMSPTALISETLD